MVLKNSLRSKKNEQYKNLKLKLINKIKGYKCFDDSFNIFRRIWIAAATITDLLSSYKS